MDIEKVKQAQTQEEARQFAVEWQTTWQDENPMEWGSVDWKTISEWSQVFAELANRFDLMEEFLENGII